MSKDDFMIDWGIFIRKSGTRVLTFSFFPIGKQKTDEMKSVKYFVL